MFKSIPGEIYFKPMLYHSQNHPFYIIYSTIFTQTKYLKVSQGISLTNFLHKDSRISFRKAAIPSLCFEKKEGISWKEGGKKF